MNPIAVVSTLLLASTSFALGSAPGGPGISFPRATAEKQGFGTSYESYDTSGNFSERSLTAPISKVWFTLARGIVTEVFYPRIDAPQTRDTQLLITDGHSFLHQEQTDTLHEVTQDPRGLLYTVINRDRSNRYRIEKEIWADPNSPVLVQKIKVIRNVPGLRFYALHKPMAGNSLFGDLATTEPELSAGQSQGKFAAWQTLTSSLGWEKKSVGYVGVNDGYQDLLDFKQDYEFSSAGPGNVALVGKLPISEEVGETEFALFLNFGSLPSSALQTSQKTFSLQESRKQYLDQWSGYLAPLHLDFNGANKNLVTTSALILKAAEDKTYPGSVIASPSFPWGETFYENKTLSPEQVAGYSVVWPRDLYHIGNGFLAVHDYASAEAVLRRYQATQLQESHGKWNFYPRIHSKKGSWPQNFWVDSTPLYGGYQADETAMPILFAHTLWKKGIVSASDVWTLVKEGADFLSEVGPWTQTERWEESYGISPNSAAFVIRALSAASEVARALGQPGGSRYEQLANDWSFKPGDNIDTWTFTTQGRIEGNLGNGRYYLRLDGAGSTENGSPRYDAIWNPNLDEKMSLANFEGPERFKYESEIVDAGFLALVRLGIRQALSPLVEDSLQEIDSLISRKTPHATGFYRYRFDGYGENKRGRLWPVLTGERLEYQYLRAKELGQKACADISSYESFANPQGIFSEQVWDEGALAGKPTGSATPLLWSHAQYLELLDLTSQ